MSLPADPHTVADFTALQALFGAACDRALPARQRDTLY